MCANFFDFLIFNRCLRQHLDLLLYIIKSVGAGCLDHLKHCINWVDLDTKIANLCNRRFNILPLTMSTYWRWKKKKMKYLNTHLISPSQKKCYNLVTNHFIIVMTHLQMLGACQCHLKQLLATFFYGIWVIQDQKGQETRARWHLNTNWWRQTSFSNNRACAAVVKMAADSRCPVFLSHHFKTFPLWLVLSREALTPTDATSQQTRRLANAGTKCATLNQH